MHSIRVKITAIAVVAIFTCMLSVFAASYFTMQVDNDRRSVDMMNLIDRDTQKSLEKYLQSVEQSVEMVGNVVGDTLDSVVLVECGVAGSHAIQGEQTPEQAAKLDAYLAGHCARVQEAFASVASHTHGVVTYYYCISPDISQTQHGFFYSRVGKTGFDEQEPLDARQLDPEDIEHTTWYYTPIQRGRPSWIGPYTAHFLNEMWTCSYIMPIYKAGTFIGVLGMDIPFETLAERIESIRVYDSGFACLIREDGRVLSHPDLPMGASLDDLGVPGLSEMFTREDSEDALIRYTVGGEDRQMTFSTMSNGMKLVIVAPTREIKASWIQLTRVLLLIMAAGIVLFAVVLLLVMGVITRPLQRLTAASQQLAGGDYDVELDYRGNDEVGKLTHAFGQMRDQQKAYFDDLNRQIYTDSLTGLPNMRYFFKLAETERKRMLEAGGHPAVLYFNLVGMKQFNRQYGFSEGDRLIREVAAILLRHYGEKRVSRFSQDHFAALTDEDGLEAQLEVVFRDCQAANGGMSLPVRVGIYTDRLEDVDISVACDRAKYACDQQKGAYISSFCWFDERMLRYAENFRYITSHLDQALSEGWIAVYHQAIVRAANGKVCDEEALARWIDPVRGTLSPADFIPILENARLIYKLDLYVVDQILEKMKQQAAAGLHVVPESVNLSRADFDSCDIVEEIRRRVDAAGIDREKLTIEITESMVGSDFDFMKAQVERFQALGFQVWMDDFGSGYSSLDVLQNIHFDVIKFDMRFMDRFDSGDEGKIILTELVRMAIGLGVETVCEGVEKAEQVEFLREIGCTKIQGYYYCRPIPFEEIIDRNKKGIQIGFENPDETEYYATIGNVNLYDMSAITGEGEESFGHYFDTLPMCIIEVSGSRARYVRCNRAYRDFRLNTLGRPVTDEYLDYGALSTGAGSALVNAVRRCSLDETRALVDEKIDEDTTVHAFVRRIAVNPVTGVVAVAVAVLSILKNDENDGTNYAHIAKALSADYLFLYYVNLDTERFIEYSPDAQREDLTVERHGEDFFAASVRDAQTMIYEDDRAYVLSAFNRRNIEEALDAQGTFTLTYRLMIDGTPTYVSMKVMRMQGDRSHIIIGVNNVDSQMQQKEALERVKAEQTTYARIAALSGNYICIYTVDPATDRYMEYSATQAYEGLGLAKEGDDFFNRAREDAALALCPEDLDLFRTRFNRENVLREIERTGLYELKYRLMIDGEPRYVSLRGALVEEKDGPRLVIGVNNIDAQVRRELEYERKLSSANARANLDRLTGLKNKMAYEDMSEKLSRQIEGGQTVRYAIALCRVKDLDRVNEERGRKAGDRLIREACAIICDIFKHSPVFRVTGDQFAAVAQGHDYEHIDDLLMALEASNRINSREGGAVIACGMARYDGVSSVTAVFERADALCREDG